MAHGTPRGDGTESGAQRLVRARLIRRMSAGAAAGAVLVSGPHGSGKTTLVRSWARRSGVELVWFEGRHAEDVARLDHLRTLLQRDAAGVGVVLHGPAARGGEALDELVELRRRHPALRLVLVRGLNASVHGHPPELRPGVVVTARDLAFTRSEAMQLGELVGARLDEPTARAVLAHTGGYALAVDTVIRQLSHTGRLTDDLLEETTDLLTAAVADGVRDEAVSAQGWQSMLRTAIPDSLSMAQLGWIWETDEPETVLEQLEGSGLLRVVNGAGEEPRLALVPALRAGLRRRCRIEMSRSRLRSTVLDMARWLEDHEDIAAAAHLLQEYGYGDELTSWAQRRWLELPSIPVARAADLLRRVTTGPGVDPRVQVAHARLLTDVFHEGHDGQLRPAELRRAEMAVSVARQALSQSEGESESDAVRAAAAGVFATLARARGEHDRAAELHRKAIEACPPEYADRLGSSLHAQAGLTALSVGDLRGAAVELDRAQDLLPEDAGTHARRLVSELARLAHGYLGDLHPSDEGSPWNDEPPGTLPGWIRALADSSRLIAQLDVGGAWQALGRLPVATGAEDPAALLALRAQAEAMAHLLSGSPTAGLGSLDVIESLLAGRVLSGFDASILRTTRAELLVAVDEPEAALAVLEAGGAPSGLMATLVRCVVLLALGRAAEAAELLEPLLPSSSTWASNYPTWMLVVASLVHSDLGNGARAEVLLGRGVAIASRSGAMLPFARQGTTRMAALIDRAREVRLDPASQALLDRLELAKERMRLASVQARLSDRELVVLEHLRETRVTRTLATLLHVSPNTVKSQLQSIYRKLGARTRDDALRAATLLGLFDEDRPA